MESTAADIRSPCDSDTVKRLQAENAALRAELQALRSNNQHQASNTVSRGEQTFDFLKLPRELRNVVYELCVVVGEVRIVRPYQLEPVDMRFKRPRDAKAEMSLFGVNRQIRREALELYLSKNHFVIHTTDVAPNDNHVEDALRLLPGNRGHEARKHLRSISTTCDSRGSIIGAYFGTEGFIDFLIEPASPEETMSVMHQHDEIALALDHRFCDILVSLFCRYHNLRRVQINLQSATCSSRCHRMVVALFNDDRVKESFEECAEYALQIESLDFLGTINKKERDTIRTAVPHSLLDKITFHGQFDRGTNAWDPDVEVFD